MQNIDLSGSDGARSYANRRSKSRKAARARRRFARQQHSLNAL